MRRQLPLIGRAVVAMARCTGLHLTHSRIEGLLAFGTTIETPVIVAGLPVAGHAGVSILEAMMATNWIHTDPGLENRARCMTNDAIPVAESTGREPHFSVGECTPMSILFVLGVDHRMASGTETTPHHLLLVMPSRNRFSSVDSVTAYTMIRAGLEQRDRDPSADHDRNKESTSIHGASAPSSPYGESRNSANHGPRATACR